MSVRYVKNSNGRGVVLGDSKVLVEFSEKETLLKTVKSLQEQIDTLNERIARLERDNKE